MNREEKTAALEALKNELAENETLPLRAANLVVGEGNPDAEVMFIGEAPGFYEDQLKRPFVGRAGKLLDRLIAENGWKRDDVYITNIVKRRPPGNRDPEPEELTAYRPYLAREVEIINPKIIAPLGRYAMNYILPFAKISNDHGRVFWWGNRLVIPLYHPAAALRSSDVLHELEKDFKKLKLLPGKYAEFLAEHEMQQKTNSTAGFEKKTQEKLL
jgi:DNA polymerase